MQGNHFFLFIKMLNC